MAVTVTVNATYIYVDTSLSTDNFDDVYTAVGDDAILSRSGSVGSYVYTVLGNRILWIRNTDTYCTLQSGATINFAYTISRSPGFRVDNATFKAEAGSTINFNSLNNNIYNRVYLYGAVFLEGTSGSHVTLNNVFELYYYFYIDGFYKQWEYVDINSDENYTTVNNLIVFTWDGSSFPSVSGNNYWRNVVIDGDPSSSGTKRGRINVQIEQLKFQEFTDCTFQNMNYGWLGYSGGAKFTRCTWKDNAQSLIFRGADGAYQVLNGRVGNTPERQGQYFGFSFDECVFDGNANGAYAFYLFYKGIGRFKNCTFQNGSSNGYRNTYASLAYFQGTQTYSGNGDDVGLFGYSVINHAYELDLTVTSDGSTPVEDAVVQVRQKEGNETVTFTTNSSGKIKDIFGDNPVFTYRQEGPEGTYDTWSDGTGDQIHILIVYKEGVGTHTEEISFTSDQTKTITLSDGSTDNETNIYDSTLYDCNLY